jgi:hypothetical protein
LKQYVRAEDIVIHLYDRVEYGLYKTTDTTHIKATINEFNNVKCYNNCYAYGIQIRSRGSDCREYKKSDEIISPDHIKNSKNNLANIWHKSNGRTWAKINVFSDVLQIFNNILTNKCLVKSNKKIRYGLVNTYFNINLGPHGEKLLENVVFSSITCRKVYQHELIKRQSIINVGGKDSYEEHIRFVPVANFYSTAIATCGFDYNNLPYKVKEINKKALTPEEAELCSKEDFSSIQRLEMIDLHPSRLCLSRN